MSPAAAASASPPAESGGGEGVGRRYRLSSPIRPLPPPPAYAAAITAAASSAGCGGGAPHPRASLCATTSRRRRCHLSSRCCCHHLPLLQRPPPSATREEAERRERESLLTLDGWIRTCRAPCVVRLGFTKPAPIIYHRCRFLKKPPPITLTTKMSVFRWPRANYSNGMDTKRCRIFNKNRHIFLTQVIGAGF